MMMMPPAPTTSPPLPAHPLHLSPAPSLSTLLLHDRKTQPPRNEFLFTVSAGQDERPNERQTWPLMGLTGQLDRQDTMRNHEM